MTKSKKSARRLPKSGRGGQVRLPSYVRPEHYLLTIKPDLDNWTFSGEEVITLSLGRAVKEITLHSKELDIESVGYTTFSAIAENVVYAEKISYNEKMETATFRFQKLIPKGKVKLRLVFRGILNDKLRGFYRSTYTHKGKEKRVATTQFEATDARRAFPCFDEPAHKAIFEVNLLVPESMTAISNTLPTEIREHESGYKIMRFAPTPKMSTYLLAFIVGDFEYVEKKSSKVTVRVYTTPGKKHQASFALDCAVKTLEFYNKYFDIPYPLNTLDMIAIPDFTSAAMENWGAITYRERFLLVDEQNSSTITKQMVAMVIAHEIAHQWFGNLVTMEWWTHLWLNEGFASYIEHLAVEHMFPEWKIWEQFASSASHPSQGEALELDALGNTHPIEIEVHHPDEIGEIFDAVSYSKGAVVIHMIASYLGEKNFRDGLRHYLKKHSYSNASTIHLWQAFEKISGKPVEKIMKTWTSKAGYPLVSVEHKGRDLHLSQSRFFASPISKKKIKDSTTWPIPLSITTDIAEKKFLMTHKKEVEKMPGKNTKWQKINFRETTLTRVRYSKEMLSLLGVPIATKKLSPIDRLGIIRDLASLSESGDSSSVDTLSMLESYRNEDSYIVWTEILGSLGEIYSLLDTKQAREQFDIFAQKLLAPLSKKIGWDKRVAEEHHTTFLRSALLASLGKYNHTETIVHAQKRFASLIKNKENVSPDIRGAIYGIVARHGSEKEYTALHKMYLTETLHEEKNRIGSSLGMFGQKSLLQKTLAFSLSKEVRGQDAVGLIASVFANRDGKALAWEFMKKNWKLLLSRYGEGGHMLSRLVESTAVFNDTKSADDIKKFFAKNPAPGAERTTLQVLEKIHSKALWKKRDEIAIGAWLKMNS